MRFGATHGPGVFRSYELKIVAGDDLSIPIDGDEKFRSIEAFASTHLRRWQSLDRLDALKKRAFLSVSISVGWLRVNASHFRSVSDSLMQ